MKIMNADGTYHTQAPVKKIPTKPSHKYAKACANLISALTNLRTNPHANIGSTTDKFIKSFAIVAHRNHQTLNHALNHYLLHAKQVTLQNRLNYFDTLCTSAGLNMTRITAIAKDYNRERATEQWRDHIKERIEELSMDRDDDPEWFFNSYQHIECGHLIYELHTGQSYHSHKSHSTTQRAKKRIHLASLGNQKRYRFIGTFVRTGFKSTFHGNGLRTGNRYAPTLLLKNVMLKNHKAITDHLWLNYTKGFWKLGQLRPNDKVIFNARVSSYLKGYGPVEDKTIDYDLSFPTKIKRIHTPKHPVKPMPINDKNALLGYIMKQNKAFYLTNDRPYDDWYVTQYNQWCAKHD